MRMPFSRRIAARFERWTLAEMRDYQRLPSMSRFRCLFFKSFFEYFCAIYEFHDEIGFNLMEFLF